MAIKTEAELERALHRRGYIKRLVDEATEFLVPAHDRLWKQLDGLDCSNWFIGRWVENYDLGYVKYCMIEMPESEFEEVFNRSTDTRFYADANERIRIHRKIDEHVTTCPRCKMKQSIDRELDELINAEFTSQLAQGGANEPDDNWERAAHARNS